MLEFYFEILEFFVHPIRRTLYGKFKYLLGIQKKKLIRFHFKKQKPQTNQIKRIKNIDFFYYYLLSIIKLKL